MPDTQQPTPDKLSTLALGLVAARYDMEIDKRIREHNRCAVQGDAEGAAAHWQVVEAIVERKARLELDALRQQCIAVASYPVRIGIGDNMAALWPERGL